MSQRGIDIEGLRVGYGAHGYRYPQPISCCAQRGELVALVGRNGVGKNTLLRCVAGLQRPQGGRVLLGGADVAQMERRHRAQLLSFIPAEPPRSPNTTVRGFVELARYPRHGWFAPLGPADHAAVGQAIDRVGMGHLAHRHLAHLSDGERQRAMIAFAMAHDTPIVLMDEPTAFLDLPNKFEVVRLLRDLALAGKTILFSTHDLPTALSMADTIWLMLPGAFHVGAPEDLIVSGAIDGLMEGTHVRFDAQAGQFAYVHGRALRPVALRASDGLLRQWTAHALQRGGFAVLPVSTEGATPLLVELADGPRWVLSRGGVRSSFGSLRSLMLALRE
ncbi:MAG: ABC transporter ATP-binding protein [Bacteroidales bacterium]|nr:ABC transporter ATP-binding protein [Bacteroidales bacterium]